MTDSKQWNSFSGWTATQRSLIGTRFRLVQSLNNAEEEIKTKLDEIAELRNQKDRLIADVVEVEVAITKLGMEPVAGFNALGDFVGE